MAKGAGLKILWLSAFVGSNPTPHIILSLNMIALHKKKYLYNVYISKDKHHYHRRDCGIDTLNSTFELYARNNGWHIVARLDHITEKEKDALFGYYNGEQLEPDRLQNLTNKLNNGGLFYLDSQEELNKEYSLIQCSLRNFNSF